MLKNALNKLKKQWFLALRLIEDQDVDVVKDSDVVAVDMDVALVRESDASEEATQAVVPHLMAIRAVDILDTPDILLASLKVAVRFVPMTETTMVCPLSVSKPTTVDISMEEDITLLLPVVDAVVMPSVNVNLDVETLEVVLITPIIYHVDKGFEQVNASGSNDSDDFQEPAHTSPSHLNHPYEEPEVQPDDHYYAYKEEQDFEEPYYGNY